MPSKSAFATWFKSQFGFLPMPDNRRQRLEDEYRRLNGKVALMLAQLKTDDILREQFRAALYAWNAKSASPSTPGASK